MENNKERKGFVAYALTAFLIVSFFIITTTSLAFSAQPQVAAGGTSTVGLKSDGTVVAVGMNNAGECDVSSWTDIVQVAAARYHTVGLKSDGTVVAVGDNSYGQCGVSSWTDIVQVAAGDCHTVGLKADGTVVAVGYNDYGACEVSSWTDIVQVAAGGNHTVGLKSDGTVVAVGANRRSQCNLFDWNLATDSDGDGIPDSLDACPTEDATGFDADGDGCIDSADDLGTLVESLLEEGVIDEAMENCLLSKIENAENSADKDNICTAINQLEALKNSIDAQSGKKISDEAADQIIAYVDSLIAWYLDQLPEGESC